MTNQGMAIPKPYGEDKSDPFVKRITCAICGKKYKGKFIDSMGVCYGCGKGGHQLKDCPIRAAKEREITKAPTNIPNPNAPKKSLLCSLQ